MPTAPKNHLQPLTTVQRIMMLFDGRWPNRADFSISRYEHLPKGWHRDRYFIVGWDADRQTYYAKLMDYSLWYKGTVLVWKGAVPPYYTDIDELMRAFNETTGQWWQMTPVILQNKVRQQLAYDREQSVLPPTSC